MKASACCLALTLVLLTGCVSLSPDEIAVRTHYRIDLDPGPMGGPSSDLTIGIRPFSQSGSLDREGIRYQTSDVEGGYFSTHLWSEPVSTMVQSVVYEDLDAARLFRRVLLLGNVGSADLYVDADVHRFGEEDGPNGWTGVVEITFEVTAAATGEVVFHRRLKAAEAASEPTVKETVRAISRALSRILGELRSALAAEFGEGALMDARGDQARFFGKLAALMSAGIPMLRAFEVGVEGVGDAGLGGALTRIMDRAYGGSSLTEAFEGEATWFTSEVRTLIAVGEERGEVERVAAAISDGLERCVFDPGRPGEDPAGPGGDPLSRLLERARDEGATDIHAEPAGGRLRVRIRVDGLLRDLDDMDGVQGAELLLRARRRAGIETPAGSGADFGEFTEGDVHVRVDLASFVEGEGMVLRMSPSLTSAPALNRAGLSDESRDEIRSWLSRPNGMILVAGPLGSGRRDLLAALAGELDPETRRIIAVGWSAAFRLPAVSRIRTTTGRGPGYGEAIEAALDQDPDVVLLEALPDEASAKTAMATARSGHLALAATGAAGAPEAVLDLLRLGVEPDAAADAVIGAIACRRSQAFDGQRVNSFEVMTLTPELAEIVRQDPSRDRLRSAAVAGGMTPFRRGLSTA